MVPSTAIRSSDSSGEPVIGYRERSSGSWSGMLFAAVRKLLRQPVTLPKGPPQFGLTVARTTLSSVSFVMRLNHVRPCLRPRSMRMNIRALLKRFRRRHRFHHEKGDRSEMGVRTRAEMCSQFGVFDNRNIISRVRPDLNHQCMSAIEGGL